MRCHLASHHFFTGTTAHSRPLEPILQSLTNRQAFRWQLTTSFALKVVFEHVFLSHLLHKKPQKNAMNFFIVIGFI